MPSISDSTPRAEATFAGVTFAVPQFYSEGQTLTANDARAVNGWATTTLGNRFSAKIRAGVEALKSAGNKKATAADLGWDMQAEFDAFASAYEFGRFGSGERKAKSSVDPIEALMRSIAEAELKASIVGKGLKVRDFMTAKVTVDGTEVSKFKALLDQKLARDADSLRARAEATLEDAVTDDLDLDAEVDTTSEAA